MQKLISELNRLYIAPGTLAPELLARRLHGDDTAPVSLATGDGRTRAIVIPFPKVPGGAGDEHWTALCEVASTLQTQLGLPAPAVSISGANGYALWLSLTTPAPLPEVQRFLTLLRQAYLPDMALPDDAAGAPLELPPCLHPDSGKWAAFIHPGMGASFADESGLDMAPPFSGQAAFLEGLHSITPAQWTHALAQLQTQLQTQVQQVAAAPVAAGGETAASARIAANAGGGTTAHGANASAPSPSRHVLSEDLLLKDATLEDIIAFLHARNIEPSFRHLLPR